MHYFMQISQGLPALGQGHCSPTQIFLDDIFISYLSYLGFFFKNPVISIWIQSRYIPIYHRGLLVSLLGVTASVASASAASVTYQSSSVINHQSSVSWVEFSLKIVHIYMIIYNLIIQIVQIYNSSDLYDMMIIYILIILCKYLEVCCQPRPRM